MAEPAIPADVQMVMLLILLDIKPRNISAARRGKARNIGPTVSWRHILEIERLIEAEHPGLVDKVRERLG